MEKDERKAIMDKEIDLIQGCISRMAQNSFIIKGWAITLVAVALALLPETFDAKLHNDHFLRHRHTLIPMGTISNY